MEHMILSFFASIRKESKEKVGGFYDIFKESKS